MGLILSLLGKKHVNADVKCDCHLDDKSESSDETATQKKKSTENDDSAGAAARQFR
jgi:hypothetical protein